MAEKPSGTKAHDDERETATVTAEKQTVPAWLVAMGVVLLAAVVFFIVYGNWNRWESAKPFQTTDDAYVHADVTAVGTKTVGVLTKMAVEEYQHVRRGELIATIRQEDFQAQVDTAQAALEAEIAGLEQIDRQKQIADSKVREAEAGLRAAENQVEAALAGKTASEASVVAARAGITSANAQLVNQLQERERQEGLFSGQATTLRALQGQQAQSAGAQALLDSKQSDLSAAQAQLRAKEADIAEARAGVQSSQAELDEALDARRILDARERQIKSEVKGRRAMLEAAKISLSYTTVLAPADGYIASRDVLPGQMVNVGTTIVSLIEQRPWVLANFKETQLRRIRVGDPVEIRIDTFPSTTWKGQVLVIAPASGAQTALLPPDNATGNFTKIVQRIPIKIAFERDQRLQLVRAGMSATVTVRTEDH